MASACVNNIGMAPDVKAYPSYGWLSPRVSFRCEEGRPDQSKTTTPTSLDTPELQDPVEFEFQVDDPVTMLPAEELFSEGKLMPLQLGSSINDVIKPFHSSEVNAMTGNTARSPEQPISCRRMQLDNSGTDPYLFSPKAPGCYSRWKELLGFRKLGQKPDKTAPVASSSLSSTTAKHKSVKHFLQKSYKPCICSASLDHSLSLPLLKDSDYNLDSISLSPSFSLDNKDLPSLFLNAENSSTTTTSTTSLPSPNPFVSNRAHSIAVYRARMLKARRSSSSLPSSGCQISRAGSSAGRSPMQREVAESRGVSVDSPRINSSGKIVFQSLERSSSSPGSFNGGPRLKHRGIERSYSANVRVTPVLNVPVCSLGGSCRSFGFGQLFSSSPQKREGINKAQNHHHHHHHLQSNYRNRIDRT